MKHDPTSPVEQSEQEETNSSSKPRNWISKFTFYTILSSLCFNVYQNFYKQVKINDLEKEVSSLKAKNDAIDPRNQNFEAYVVSIKRDRDHFHTLSAAEQKKYKDMQQTFQKKTDNFFNYKWSLPRNDTFDINIGFNPQGLHLIYKDDERKQYYRGDLVPGCNQVVFNHDTRLFNQNQYGYMLEVIEREKKEYNINDDTLQFVTSANEVILSVPLGTDLSFAQKLNPSKPALIVFESCSKNPKRDGLTDMEETVRYAKSIYEDHNVIVIHDPNDTKIKSVANIFKDKFPQTRIDFCTILEHRETAKSAEFSYRDPYTGKDIDVGSNNYIDDNMVVRWIKEFPGSLQEKRLALFECNVPIRSGENKNLNKLGVVISPAPKQLYNFGTLQGRAGKEILRDLRDFDLQKSIEPQIMETKKTLSQTYDKIVVDEYEKETSRASFEKTYTTKEIENILADPLNQVYVNPKTVFDIQKNSINGSAKQSSKARMKNTLSL